MSLKALTFQVNGKRRYLLNIYNAKSKELANFIFFIQIMIFSIFGKNLGISPMKRKKHSPVTYI
jgi:hypothetical protein